MTILLSALAVAFAAFSIWLIVRFVNRRETWAKQTGSAMILIVAYGAAYWTMMQPFVQAWRPGGGLG